MTALRPSYRDIVFSQPERGYRFKGKCWTESSELVDWDQGNKYCIERGCTLPTLEDALTFRDEANGIDNADGPQHTRNMILMRPDGDRTRGFLFEMTQDRLAQIGSLDPLRFAGTLRKKFYKQIADTSPTFLLAKNYREVRTAFHKDRPRAFYADKTCIRDILINLGLALSPRTMNAVMFSRTAPEQQSFVVDPIGLSGTYGKRYSCEYGGAYARGVKVSTK